MVIILTQYPFSRRVCFQVFLRASQMARRLKIPRIYVSVNSGARIGLASEVMSAYKIAWEDEAKPWKGFRYLYLTPDDYRALADQEAVKAEAIEDEGESRYKITDIYGVQDGLGVECLKASGMIAGETSMAYEETFTCTLVSTRSVGIGAYPVQPLSNPLATIVQSRATALCNPVQNRATPCSRLESCVCVFCVGRIYWPSTPCNDHFPAVWVKYIGLVSLATITSQLVRTSCSLT